MTHIMHKGERVFEMQRTLTPDDIRQKANEMAEDMRLAAGLMLDLADKAFRKATDAYRAALDQANEIVKGAENTARAMEMTAVAVEFVNTEAERFDDFLKRKGATNGKTVQSEAPDAATGELVGDRRALEDRSNERGLIPDRGSEARGAHVSANPKV